MSDVPVADLVLRNAKVVTFTASQPQAESIAVKDGRVLAVGSANELAPLTAAARHTAHGTRPILTAGYDRTHRLTFYTPCTAVSSGAVREVMVSAGQSAATV